MGMLEKKSISITRLKLSTCTSVWSKQASWKEKHLDYEIETRHHLTETPYQNACRLKRKASRLRDWNKVIASCSTRSSSVLKRKASRLRDWNEFMEPAIPPLIKLEKKSISITRLKPADKQTLEPVPRQSWKEKHLDYEIETYHGQHTLVCLFDSWKEKHLDYEIETWIGNGITISRSNLKRKASRLRDWNFHRHLDCYQIYAWKEKHLDYEIET